jgi:signal transduction histidine kinase
MKRGAGLWLVFAACNLVVVAALVWTSAVVLRLERAEQTARAETDYQESLRLALWRMDSWLSLFLAKEAARPAGDETPDSDLVSLRFTIDAGGVATTHGRAELASDLTLDAMRSALGRADAALHTKPGSAPRPEAKTGWFDVEILKSKNEYDARVACATPGPPGADPAGRQAVAWLASAAAPASPTLAFLRRVGAGSDERYSGFVIDWPKLRERLLAEIHDLFPAADLVPAPAVASADARELGLANVPVTLHAPHPVPVALSGITAGRAALGLAWLAVIGGMVAVGFTLGKSIDLGERRRRFVSAVTHELRTPLTTFQMYSEMLADGMIQDETQRRSYLAALKDESRRLSAMVTNVLSHARLEERRGPRRVESLTLEALVERVRPRLAHRAEASGMTLDVTTGRSSETPLAVDPDAIGQILANLVDNATKYARAGAPASIALDASTANGSLVMTVSDHGPGVPQAQTRAIFAPFERGGRDAADPIPGVGLGLALSRGLARDMGGDLTLDTPNGRGATFRLVLPVRPR